MNADTVNTYTAFLDGQRLVTAPLPELLTQVKRHLDESGGQMRPILIFDDTNGAQLDFNFQGTLAQVLARAQPPTPPERLPDTREVRLLPRHWDWLDQQPSGASATLRRLVEAARKAEAGAGRLRQARDAASRFLTVMAGDATGLEDIQRALYAQDRERFEALLLAADWSEAVSAHALYLAQGAFQEEEQP
ncbi:DUF2239 family protein [Deinococcus sp.]|uniref:DUF2239 family protein n=1 Tax=Deinococcus sp. TaxID=47478 RepID=UPI003B5A5CB2